jgi:CelD/BcsL family acetyltransferase involved in cellulose biosynthesis
MPLADYGRWDRLVAGAHVGTVYHTAQWLTTVSQAVGDTPHLLGIFDGGELVGGIPLQLRARGPCRILRRAYATPYSGLLCHEGMSGGDQARAEAALSELLRRYSCATITSSPFLPPTNVAPLHGRRLATYLLKTRSPGGLWRTFASELRNRIRKAESAGVTVSVEPHCDPFFAMFSGLFAAKGAVVPFSPGRFSAFLAAVAQGNMGRLYVARMPSGVVCAAALILEDAHRAYYSLAASDLILRKNGCASLLVWQVLQDCGGRVPEFDFGGANVPAVAEFKRKFRGTLRGYHEHDTYSNLAARFMIQTYRHLRPSLP